MLKYFQILLIFLFKSYYYYYLLSIWSNKGIYSLYNQETSSYYYSTPFFLQDQNDEQCLSYKGYGICDELAVWILIKSQQSNLYSMINLFSSPYLSSTSISSSLNSFNSYGICLISNSKSYFYNSKVSLGSCKHKSSKYWDFKFIDKDMLIIYNQNSFLQRGNPYRYSVSLSTIESISKLPPLKGSSSTSSSSSPPTISVNERNSALRYQPTSIHEAGFFIKSSDGLCFDGDKFRVCANPSTVLWGIGIKFLNGEALRFIHIFNNRSICIESKGTSVYRGTCDKKTALGWSLYQGKLQYDGTKGINYLTKFLPHQSRCLVRKEDQNGTQVATMIPCNEGFEYLLMELPTTFSSDDLRKMLREDNERLTEAEKASIESMIDDMSKKGSNVNKNKVDENEVKNDRNSEEENRNEVLDNKINSLQTEL